LMLTT